MQDSDIQKLARLTHRSVIANVLQVVALESIVRHRDVEVVLGVLPLSHVQGIVASHGSIYVRDRFILHTKFDMKEAMASIQGHRINRLYLVINSPDRPVMASDLVLITSIRFHQYSLLLLATLSCSRFLTCRRLTRSTLALVVSTLTCTLKRRRYSPAGIWSLVTVIESFT
jgi:acyl-CoA synthetase (AMP-forming)/AMP-acid ligase II